MNGGACRHRRGPRSSNCCCLTRGVPNWLSLLADQHAGTLQRQRDERWTGSTSASREQNAAKAEEIEVWLERVAAAYNVLPMDAAAFRIGARLMHRRSNTLYEDAMIAATAKVHGLTVVTRNVADFKAFGVPLLNPFKT